MTWDLKLASSLEQSEICSVWFAVSMSLLGLTLAGPRGQGRGRPIGDLARSIALGDLARDMGMGDLAPRRELEREEELTDELSREVDGRCVDGRCAADEGC